MNASNAMYDPNTKTCSGVYCHSNGAVNGADASNLVYKSTPAWYTGTFDANKCGSCHDNLPQYAGQSHYTATGFMGKEGGHLVGIHFDNIYNGSNGLLAAGAADPSSHGDPATSTTMTCYLCHNGEVSSTTIDTYANNLGSSSMKCANCHTSGTPTPLQIGAISNKNLHVNGLKNVTLANTTLKSKAQLADSSIPAGWTRHGTYKTAGSYDSATMSSSDWNSGTKTCTTACHNGQPVTWGATNITCVSCHTALP
jgi:predicted CxxxxCH...CXXCH cytochrome family protein